MVFLQKRGVNKIELGIKKQRPNRIFDHTVYSVLYYLVK